MLYALNLYSDACQLFINKTGGTKTNNKKLLKHMQKLRNIEFGNDFLDVTLKEQATKKNRGIGLC